MFRARFTILFILAASACLAAQDGAYVNPRYRFSFTPPAGWAAKQHPDAVAVFMEPTGERPTARLGGESNREFIERINRKLLEPALPASTFRANVTITAVKVLPGITIEQYAKQTRDRFSGLKLYRVLGEKSVKADGVPAVLRAMRVDLAEGGSIRTREIIVIKGDSALSFTLAAAPDSFNRHSLEFDRAMATLKWTK